MKWVKLFENFQELENIVIVGGGISSLYAAYLLKKRFPKIKYTILEKNSECGGRVKMSDIDGIKIHTGAQFLRVGKDKTLTKLLKDLEIELEPYEMKMSYTFDEYPVVKMVNKLKKNISKFDRSKFTFSQFANEVLGVEEYSRFLDMMGYTDFENADFVDIVKNYGLEDNMPGYKAANVPWDKVIKKLIDFVGKENIKLNTQVDSIEKNSNRFIVNSKYECDGIIIGVTVEEIRKLIDKSIYKEIESQEFLKIFAKSNELKKLVKNYTVVDSPLNKIIPLKDDVFTVSFSDNDSANFIKTKDNKFIEKLLSKHFNTKIDLQKVKRFYWKEGTHYYKPLSNKWNSREDFIQKAQHPQKNIWVIGEMVAEKQGWVEGALLSVENINLFN